MDAYTTWLDRCDKILALTSEGRMTDDYPDYDWHDAYEWGDTPRQAVNGAMAMAARRV